MTNSLIEELIDISRKKLELLNSMLEVTQEQKKSIDEENMEKVELFINTKDRLMEDVDKLDVEFLTKFSQIKKKNNVDDIDELDVERYPKLKDLKEVVKDISSTLMAISMLDKENNAVMRKKLESVKSNLRKVKKGQKAYKGYNKTIDNNIFIDEKK